MVGIVLASASAQRLRLLRQVGVGIVEAVAPEVEEGRLAGESATEMVRRLACAKALAVSARYPSSVVLAGDVAVVSGGRVLEKALDSEEVSGHLRRLSGRTHRVYGGVCVVRSDGVFRARVVCTRVRFKVLGAVEIAHYAALREGEGCAGGYAIQGYAGCFVVRLVGSWSNVVGLPLYESMGLLRWCGVCAS